MIDLAKPHVWPIQSASSSLVEPAADHQPAWPPGRRRQSTSGACKSSWPTRSPPGWRTRSWRSRSWGPSASCPSSARRPAPRSARGASRSFPAARRPAASCRRSSRSSSGSGLAQSLKTRKPIIAAKNSAVCSRFRLAGGGSGSCMTAASRFSSSLRKIAAMITPMITANDDRADHAGRCPSRTPTPAR